MPSPEDDLIVCNCPHCVSKAAEGELICFPARDIPVDSLSEYTRSGHGWRDEISRQFRQFLPRYFDLIAHGHVPGEYGIESCLARLGMTDHTRIWPPEEVDAVSGYLRALLRKRLSEGFEIDATGLPMPDRNAVEQVLCMAAHVGPIGPARSGFTIRGGILRFGRERVEAGMHAIQAWLLRPQTRERLETACLAETDTNAAALLSHAEGLLAALM